MTEDRQVMTEDRHVITEDRHAMKEDQNKPGTFEVFDINGRKVYSQALPQWSTLQQINLPELAGGIYQCMIKSGSSVAAKKVAVIRE